jgi:hypothetical protein
VPLFRFRAADRRDTESSTVAVTLSEERDSSNLAQ